MPQLSASQFIRQALPQWLREGALDLHLHSTASDGTDSPSEILALAQSRGLRVLALSDHDCLDGCPEILAAAAALPPDERPLLLPAVELALDFEGEEVHLLAYFLELPQEPELLSFLAQEKEKRLIRNRKLCQRLNELGFPLTLEELYQGPPSSSQVVNRPHFACWLVEHGYCHDINEAFSRYLAKDRPAYVPRAHSSLKLVLPLLRQAGAFTSLAHPQQYAWCQSPRPELLPPRLLEQAAKLQKLGLDALEAYHGEATSEEQGKIAACADLLGLLCTLGSDYHGTNRKHAPMYRAGQIQIATHKKICVLAAALRDEQGRFLLARRAVSEPSAGLWEFPGGKREPGEENRAALQRELREELALEAEIGPLLAALNFDYPETEMREAFSCRLLIYEGRAPYRDACWQVHDTWGFYDEKAALELPLLAADRVFFESLRDGTLPTYPAL